MTRVLIDRSIDKYATTYTSAESPALAALNRETNMKVDKAVMLSGHVQGAFLQMVSHMIRPMCVLELGTFTGYSAICLAQGLQDGGIVHTIDINEELYDIAHKHIVMAGLEHQIVQHIGKAADVIPTLNATYDLVFIDADKPGYAQYYDMVIDHMRPGGFILADNVLFEGEVTLPEEQQNKNALAMHKFNQKIKADERVEHVLLPLRDGIMLMRKR